jgi:hypothetical protein
MPFDNIEWEKLHWFLKFLIPKLTIKDKNKDTLDELLESVDLSTYGLERIKLKQHIGLDDSDSELDPQNPNVRGVHNDEEPKDPLEVIIQTSNNKNYNFMMFFKPLSTNDLYLMLVSYSVIGRIICTIFPYNNTGKIVSRETFF